MLSNKGGWLSEDFRSEAFIPEKRVGEKGMCSKMREIARKAEQNWSREVDRLEKMGWSTGTDQERR